MIGMAVPTASYTSYLVGADVFLTNNTKIVNRASMQRDCFAEWCLRLIGAEPTVKG